MTKPTNLDWLRAHVNHDGKECLIWPFSRSRGYAQVGVNRKVKKASRIMCEWVNGQPPSPKYEAAHSCGRGKEGCVNPKHLSWKTRSDNQRDRRKHGTHGRGPNMNARRIAHKLNPTLVAEIRAIGDSMSKEAIGRLYGVTPSNVAKILKRESWKVDGIFPKRGWAVTPWLGSKKKKVVAVGEIGEKSNG